MSALFGGGSAVGETKPQYTGLQLQTSSNAVPIPIVGGLVRLAPNLIWYDDFKAHKKEQKQGGKGGGVTQVSYTYSASLMMGLCEGPIDSIPKAWRTGSTQGSQKWTSVAELGFTIFDGEDPQSPWSYLTTKHPSAALSYNGLALLAAANYNLGNSASLPTHSFEVAALHYNTGVGGTVPDADPALWVDEYLTNERWGAGFPTNMIDYDHLLSGPNATTTGDDHYQTYCRALGLAMSPILSESEAAADAIQRWADITNSAPVWDGSKFKLIPRGDSNITANGVTFLANTTPQYELTETDFVADKGDDPILIDLPDFADLYNQVRVQVKDRNNAYNLKPCDAKDDASIEMFGIRTDSDFKAHEICSPEMGSLIAYLMVQRKVYIRVKYRFVLDMRYCRLEPMDVVSLTSARMHMDQLRVRLITVDETEEGNIQCEAEEYPAGPATAYNYAIQPNESVPVNAAEAPGDVNAPIIFEPPASLVNNTPQVWVAVSGASEFWGGCNVWASTDDSTYSQIGTINNPCTMGVLTATLAAYASANPDTAHTASVDLTESQGELLSTTALDASAGVTLCYCGGELFSYTDALLTDDYEYDLTTLYRGLYGTTASSHASSTPFARLDQAFKYNLPQDYIGQTIYLKFTSFNTFGQVEQSLADVTAYTYDPTGAAYNELGTAVTYVTPTNGFSYQMTGGVLYLTPAGTLATGELIMPVSPLNNQQVQVFTTEEITALTVTPSPGQSLSGAPTTLLANTNFTMVYRTSDSTWYRL